MNVCVRGGPMPSAFGSHPTSGVITGKRCYMCRGEGLVCVFRQRQMVRSGLSTESVEMLEAGDV
jgi:hypothetical protein